MLFSSSGGVAQTLNDCGSKFGWNWTFWYSILKHIILQIGSKSLIYGALSGEDISHEISLFQYFEDHFSLHDVYL